MTRDELEHYAAVLVGQADELVHQLGVNVSSADTYHSGSVTLRRASDAYQRLAVASQKATQVAWERTIVSGRTGRDLMERLGEVRQSLHNEELAAKIVS